MTEDSYLEAVLEWRRPGGEEAVSGWLRQRGFGVARMTTGLLVSGRSGSFAQAFGIGPTVGPVELVVPEELRAWVSAITVTETPQITT